MGVCVVVCGRFGVWLCVRVRRCMDVTGCMGAVLVVLEEGESIVGLLLRVLCSVAGVAEVIESPAVVDRMVVVSPAVVVDSTGAVVCSTVVDGEKSNRK